MTTKNEKIYIFLILFWIFMNFVFSVFDIYLIVLFRRSCMS